MSPVAIGPCSVATGQSPAAIGRNGGRRASPVAIGQIGSAKTEPAGPEDTFSRSRPVTRPDPALRAPSGVTSRRRPAETVAQSKSVPLVQWARHPACPKCAQAPGPAEQWGRAPACPTQVRPNTGAPAKSRGGTPPVLRRNQRPSPQKPVRPKCLDTPLTGLHTKDISARSTHIYYSRARRL